MAGRVAGKVAIVTGAASGIGRVSAETLAREGARVVVADLDREGGEAAAAAIEAAGGEAIAVQTWDETLRIDLRGPMLGCKHAIPRMIESGGGSIVNTSSNAALAGDLTLTAYAAAKGGLNSLTLSVATAFGKQGIRCNAVSPAHIESPSLASVVPPEVVEMLRAQCLTPRMGVPQDVANLVLYLASDEASFVTGQILRVDGGALSHLAHVAELRASGGTMNRAGAG